GYIQARDTIFGAIRAKGGLIYLDDYAAVENSLPTAITIDGGKLRMSPTSSITALSASTIFDVNGGEVYLDDSITIYSNDSAKIADVHQGKIGGSNSELSVTVDTGSGPVS